MHHYKPAYYLPFLFLLLLMACHDEKKIKVKEIVADPASIDAVIQKNIKDQLSFASDNHGLVPDSFRIELLPVLLAYYEEDDHLPLWSSKAQWSSFVDPFISYLDSSVVDGLFRDDYHYADIMFLKASLDEDSVKRMDAVLWAKADVLFTDAFMHVIQDLKQGRLQPDTLDWKHDPARHASFFIPTLKLLTSLPLDSILKQLQPAIQGYWHLKEGIKNFLDSMDTKNYMYVPYPYKIGDKADSASFVEKLVVRFKEASIPVSDKPDSLQLSISIKKYQQHVKVNPDGKISPSLIRKLNMTDVEKYNRIAITLDRYKQLPDTMPEKYVLVNLPGYYLQVWDMDTITFTSKVICGKPSTPTPFITSAINNMVIYPTWTVPTSIIKKEILPGLKKSSGYLAKKGLNLYNNRGELVDPATVNWEKYSKGIPYKVQQGSGDNNALGVIKFNFNNPYDVYLHDTNQRYLFKNSSRALSHGCVRVQDWEKLAFYLVRNDSLHMKSGDTLSYNTDSIVNWIAKKEKHRVEVNNKIPLFIRYFGCDAVHGSLKFYDDIYDEDKKVKEKYFAHNSVRPK
ncbi:MAG: L,D-transpeptidase family protein [Ferruginibacter sp.]